MGRALFVYGGPIYTMSSAGRVEAMLVVDGKVVATGPRETLELLVPAGCRRVDLAGNAVFPGMQDCHIHLNHWSIGRRRVDLVKTKNMKEGLELIRKAAQAASPGEWITGAGYDMSVWPEWPDCHSLDTVSPQNPVFMSSKDGHSGWANTVALRLSGVDSRTPAPAGGEIRKDASGEPTGILLDRAKGLVGEHVPAVPLDAMADAVRDGIEYLQTLGLTGVHVVDGSAAFSAAQRLAEQGLLPCFRLACCPSVEDLDAVIQTGLRQGFGSEHLITGPVKMFKDGALGSATAWMLRPFEGSPDNRGLEVMTNDQISTAVEKAALAGFGTAVHAIGDLGCRQVLDIFEKHGRLTASAGVRQRMEHAQLLTETDVPRFAKLSVIASVQPAHAVADRYMVDRLWGARGRWAYPFESLRRTGAVVAFGSDGPVDNPDPIYGIHCAVNRNAVGEPESAAWYPEERMPVLEAIRSYTKNAAYAIGRESVLGDLSVGKYADFVVLSRDIAEIPAPEIKTANAVATVVGGRFVYGPKW